MERKQEILGQIKQLCSGQRYAVLSTLGDSGPYASLVAFQADEDCKHLYFATPRSTRKFVHMSGEQRVALLIDNRSNASGDTFSAVGMTALGVAEEVPSDKLDEVINNYLGKHPHMKQFVTSENVALMKVRVNMCYVVNRFQEVFELDMQ